MTTAWLCVPWEISETAASAAWVRARAAIKRVSVGSDVPDSSAARPDDRLPRPTTTVQ